ncbi:MAG: diguanylate cyclase, partial [Proteobacteria bacterium]|nr:diguanylate cyclase [Pseudomonadota bacterium]
MMSNIFSFAALSYALSATSLTLLTRFSIVLSVIVSVIFEKNLKVPSRLGVLLILAGTIIVATSINSEVRNIALFWVFLVSVVKVRRSIIASNHKENNAATGDFKSEMRVTGYILAVTSSCYAALLFVTMSLGFAEYMPGVIPTKMEFFALKPLLLAMGAGAVIMASMRYTELISTKHIGGTNFLTVMAFTPLFVYTAQSILGAVQVIPFPHTNIYEVVGGCFIIIGAFLLARKEVVKKKQARKIAPKARKNLDVIRDTIRTALICFEDNTKKTASTLGITEKTLNRIMTEDKVVAKATRDKIILNHSQNVASLDHVTGVLNKTSFKVKLDGLKDVEKALILFIHLNHFKKIEDDQVKDRILKGIAERLQEKVKKPDIIARIADNGFGIIIYEADITNKDKLTKNIKKLV